MKIGAGVPQLAEGLPTRWRPLHDDYGPMRPSLLLCPVMILSLPFAALPCLFSLEFGQTERPPVGIQELDLEDARNKDLNHRTNLTRHETFLRLVAQKGPHVQQLDRCVLHSRSIRAPRG
jgi:hypothetical protein